MKRAVKKLWEMCFDDSREFTDLYFRLRYTERVNIALQEKGKLIAALQMLPYPMTFCNGIVSTGYISGACTHPDYRNQGFMRQLLIQAFARMQADGHLLTTLIPAEPWLSGYYASLGYVPLFNCRTALFHRLPDTPPDEGYQLTITDHYLKEIYLYLSRKQAERPCALLHTPEDFKVILADLHLSQGKVYALHRMREIVAVAVAYPAENGGCTIGELLYDHRQEGIFLLQAICRECNLNSLSLILPPLPDKSTDNGAMPGTDLPAEEVSLRPLGMARVLNVPAMLQRYAVCHPEVLMHFCLTDPQLPDNNGCYHLQNGVCQRTGLPNPATTTAPAHTDIKNAGQPATDCPTLTISELTTQLLAPEQPYMSLMLN